MGTPPTTCHSSTLAVLVSVTPSKSGVLVLEYVTGGVPTTTASEGLSARVAIVGGEVGGSGGRLLSLRANVRVTLLLTDPASSVA